MQRMKRMQRMQLPSGTLEKGTQEQHDDQEQSAAHSSSVFGVPSTTHCGAF